LPFLILLLAVVLQAAEKPPPARPAPHVYFEAEEFFSLQPVATDRRGFFGSGYRSVGKDDAPNAVDKTVFLFGAPGDDGYAVWVRAYADGKRDCRVAVEWIGDEGTVRLEPTHGKDKKAGFCWQRAGMLPSKNARKRHFYQLRLHAVDGSTPLIDAVLLTTDPQARPKETIRPCKDADFTGGDGEGATRINHGRVTAGSRQTLEIVYTVGPSGVTEGGALRFFVPEAWSPLQTQNQGKPGYVTATASRDGVALTIDCHRPGKGAYAYSHELRHHHECFVRLARGDLQEGDTVAVTYDAIAQPYVQQASDFRNEARAWYTPALPLGIWTDANADGVFWPVPPDRSHTMEVVAGKAAELHVVCPSVAKANEPFPIKLAALDGPRNPAPQYQGRLAFELVDLETGKTAPAKLPSPAKLTARDHGWRHIDRGATIPEPGVYAVRVRDGAAELEGVSNAIQVTAEEPPYRIVWGDLHNHHRRCDGLRSFVQAAAHARDVAGCDLVALSPHACYITSGDLADLWRVAERFHEPGVFIPIFAYEWAAGGRGASHSVIYSQQPMPLCFRAWGGGNVVRGRPALYKQLEDHNLDVIEVPHHVRGVCDHDARYQKAIEIYSQWGVHEAGVVANLNDGLKACFFGTSDNHTDHPALQSASNRWAIHHHLGGLTAFLVPKLTRESLFEAIERSRCYATAASRIIGRVQVNGHPMGSEFTLPSPEEPRVIELEALSSTPISRVVLHCNGLPIRAWTPNRSVFRTRHIHATPYGGPTDYYHVRIEAGEVKKAWLTPVWVTYEKAIPAPGEAERRAAEKAIAKMDNLARGKPVSVSFPDGITAGSPERVTDGKLDRHLGHGRKGRVWAQVDLGKARELGALRVWHYYRDRRVYYGNRIELSATGDFDGEQTVVFDSDRDGGYPESRDGRTILFEPVRARYIRNWLNCNSVNQSSQWIEIQAFGPIPKAEEERK
jgi:hypothetical protein